MLVVDSKGKWWFDGRMIEPEEVTDEYTLLKTRLEALEKWGRKRPPQTSVDTKPWPGGIYYQCRLCLQYGETSETIIHKPKCWEGKARTLGLVEE